MRGTALDDRVIQSPALTDSHTTTIAPDGGRSDIRRGVDRIDAFRGARASMGLRRARRTRRRATRSRARRATRARA